MSDRHSRHRHTAELRVVFTEKLSKEEAIDEISERLHEGIRSCKNNTSWGTPLCNFKVGKRKQSNYSRLRRKAANVV